MTVCPICKNKADIQENHFEDNHNISCASCGKYTISISALASLQYEIEKAADYKEAQIKISHLIRQSQNSKNISHINYDTIKQALKLPLPSPQEQADNMLRWIAENTDIGKEIFLVPQIDKSITGSKHPESFMMIVDHLVDKKILQRDTGALGSTAQQVKLSFDGWAAADKLTRGKSSHRKAFMAMKFGDPELEQILVQTFKPSTLDTGFKLQKLNDTQIAGLIDNRMRAEIQTSDFIIADLTHENAGAYWEAGYGEGLGKPVIYTCEKSKFNLAKTHFDTNHHLTIIWDKENPSKAGEELKATIRATLPHLAKMNDD